MHGLLWEPHRTLFPAADLPCELSSVRCTPTTLTTLICPFSALCSRPGAATATAAPAPLRPADQQSVHMPEPTSDASGDGPRTSLQGTPASTATPTMPASSSIPPASPPALRHVEWANQLQELFPHLPRNTILADLALTDSLAGTAERLLSAPAPAAASPPAAVTLPPSSSDLRPAPAVGPTAVQSRAARQGPGPSHADPASSPATRTPVSPAERREAMRLAAERRLAGFSAASGLRARGSAQL